MKNRILGLWLVFVLLFVCGVACNDNDDRDGDFEVSGIVGSVKLVEQNKGKESIDSYMFYYDSEMRLSKIYNNYPLKEDDSGMAEDTLYFSYGTDKITIVKGWKMHNLVIDENGVIKDYWESLRDTVVYTLQNGRAKNCNMMDFTTVDYKYDETTGNLISVQNAFRSAQFIWENGNVTTRQDEVNNNSVEEFEYVPGSVLNNTNIDLNLLLSTLFTGYSEDVEFGFWAGILGNKCKNLIFNKEDAEEMKFEMKGEFPVKLTAKSWYMEINYK